LKSTAFGRILPLKWLFVVLIYPLIRRIPIQNILWDLTSLEDDFVADDE